MSPSEFRGTSAPAVLLRPSAEELTACECLSCLDPRRIYPCLLEEDDER